MAKEEKTKHRWYHNPKKEIWHTDDEEAYINEILEWWDRIPDQRQDQNPGTELWDYAAHDDKSIDELIQEERFKIGIVNIATTFIIAAVIYLILYYLWIQGIF
jgi:hypothetical protein